MMSSVPFSTQTSTPGSPRTARQSQRRSVLADDAADGLDVIASVYNYVIGNVTYDDDKARTVQSGYLPDVDETLSSEKVSVSTTPR